MQTFYSSCIDLVNHRLRTIFRFLVRNLLLLAILCALSQAVFTASGEQARPHAGLRNSSGSRRLGATQLRKVLDSLRHKTGFLEMRFDEFGFLALGDRSSFVGGSASAGRVPMISSWLIPDRRASHPVIPARS
jgi:hypothetical protein